MSRRDGWPLTSLVQTCKANGIDSYRYLHALFIALPNAKTADDYEALTERVVAHLRGPATSATADRVPGRVLHSPGGAAHRPTAR